MKKNLLTYLSIIGLLAIFTACEKEGDKVVMLDEPIAPNFVSVPSMTFSRADAAKTVEFTATPVDPGFVASATYFIEAAAAGTNFADPVSIYSGSKVESVKMTVSELNEILLKKFPGDAVSSVDLRIRSILTVDAGTGAAGTGSNPFEYISATKNVSATLYGLPRLDLINSGIAQKIESAKGDGSYVGLVKVDKTKAFTLKNPDNNKTYGGAGGVLAENGAAIVPVETGWQKLYVDVTALTYKFEDFRIGLVGSATPNGWDAPDQKMDYDAKTGTWKITLDLVPGFCKFRKNDSWSWNMGLADSGKPGELKQGGVGNDIPVTVAGNYTVTFTILSDAAGTYTMVKN